jgi:ferric-dicitrate binding protein FerR (iron transport regulator)
MQENDEQKKFAEQIMIDLPGSTEKDEHEADAAFAAPSTKMHLRGHTPEKISSVRGTRSLARWTMRIAAVLIIAAVGIYTFKRLGRNKEPVVTPNAEVATAMGTRTKAVLSDGTTYWLNAGSKLTYEKIFGKNSREVSLTGEAFFDVVKLTDRPFIVHTSGIDIKVLGTAFNVKSYPDDKKVEITLYRGFVKVFRQQDSESKAIQLRPNEKLIFNRQKSPETVILMRTIVQERQ